MWTRAFRGAKLGVSTRTSSFRDSDKKLQSQHLDARSSKAAPTSRGGSFDEAALMIRLELTLHSFKLSSRENSGSLAE